MEPTSKPKINVKDFFLNLGATITLYTVVGSLINLLFTVIDSEFPKITRGYEYYNSASISWPVAILVIIFPLMILLMWLIAKEYEKNPEARQQGIHKWVSYLTLFIAGLITTADLVAVLYYFLDGQELTTAFLLKVLVLLIISSSIFTYYISEIRGKLTANSRVFWRVFALVLVLGSIIWGFSVLGSPRTQRLFKYDQEKVNDLMNLQGQIDAYYGTFSKLPISQDDLKEINYSYALVDQQTNTPYEYIKTGELTYTICAVFNKDSKNSISDQSYPYYSDSNWTHPAGRHCFEKKINKLLYQKIVN